MSYEQRVQIFRRAFTAGVVVGAVVGLVFFLIISQPPVWIDEVKL